MSIEEQPTEDEVLKNMKEEPEVVARIFIKSREQISNLIHKVTQLERMLRRERGEKI
jgi:BMFP domain-containing protein YqiC